MDSINYVLNDYWQLNGDARVAHYPLMSGGISPILTIIALYNCFVLLVGPRIMATRKAFELRRTILAYNLFNVLCNLWFFAETVRGLEYGRRLFDFDFPPRTNVSPRTLREIHVVYLYFLSKLFDLGDTIFFVLRKKQRQVSFLHVYHHSVVPLLGWIMLKTCSNCGPIGIFALLNTPIHVVMYAYYAVAALGPRYRSLLAWKRYITILQLVQFVCFILYSILFYFRQRGYPPKLFYIVYVQSPFFFFLFYRFFRRTYYAQRVDDDDTTNKTVLASRLLTTFVLRKKRRQVSLLHVFHHSAAMVLVWTGIRYCSDCGPTRIFPLLNTPEHVMIYAYYAVSTLGPRYRSLLWKRYITILQLAQFVCLFLYCLLFIHRQRGYSPYIVYFAVVQSPLFFFLFYRFFRRTYYAQHVDDNDANDNRKTV